MKRLFPHIAVSVLVVAVGVASFSFVHAQDPVEWNITIDAISSSGPSRVQDFFFTQGGPLLASDEQGSNEASRSFERAAWNALSLGSSSGVSLFDEGEGSALMSVVRSASPPPNSIGPLGPHRDLYLVTTFFDVSRQYLRETFGDDAPFLRVIGVGFMPKTLSSNPSAHNYATYPPADYDEWRSVLTAATEYLVQQGIRNPYLILFGEPESNEVFNVLCLNGRPCPYSTEPVLREYVKLFAESQRAVRAGASDMKVSAMCAGVWGADYFRELRGDPTHKGLDDFIQYVAEYNAQLPPGIPPAAIDNICWQGYSWGDQKRLVPMTEHISRVLARYGFDPAVPQYLDGWSGGWASPQGARYPLLRDASHLVYNVLDQLNPGGAPGLIKQAHYYTWNLDDAEHPTSSLVRTVHRGNFWGSLPSPSDKNCLRPAYVAFQGLKALESGAVLAMQEARPELARSIAVATDTGLRVLLVNYTDTPQTVPLALANVPDSALLDQAVIRRVPDRELCGEGNWFPAADPLSTFTSEPIGFARDVSGNLTASVVMEVNGVAMVEVPYEKPASVQDELMPGDAVSGPAAVVTNRRAYASIVIALVALLFAVIAGGVWAVAHIRRSARVPANRDDIHSDTGGL